MKTSMKSSSVRSHSSWPRSSAIFTHGTGKLVRVAERHTVLHQPFGDVGGEGETGRRFRFEAFLVEDHGADHAR